MGRFIVLLVIIAACSAGLSAWWWSEPALTVPIQLPPETPPDVDPDAETRAQAELRERCVLVQAVEPLVTSGREEPSGNPEEPDPQWEALPRTRISVRFPERFLNGALTAFPVDRVFRSPDLNSLDTYVPKAQRDMVATFIRSELNKMARLQYSVQDVGYHWLIARIASGRIEPLQFKDTPKVARHLEECGGPGVVHLQSWLFEGGRDLDWLYSVRGVTYGVKFADIPATRQPFDLLAFQRQNLAIRVAEWFCEHGCLTPNDWGLYVERVYEPR